MFGIFFVFILFAILALFLMEYISVWCKRHENFAKYFNGKVSWDGSSVAFKNKGINFLTARLSSGGGVGGTGSYGVLKMLLKDSKEFTIRSKVSLNNLRKLEVEGSADVKNAILKLISADKELEAKLYKSLSVRNSTIRCGSTIEVNLNTGLKQVHSLGIYGLSVPYLEEPETLSSEIETLLILSKALELIPE